MPEHFLDGPEVSPRIEQMRREAVPELVGRHIRREPRLGKIALHASLHETRRSPDQTLRAENIRPRLRQLRVDFLRFPP